MGGSRSVSSFLCTSRVKIETSRTHTIGCNGERGRGSALGGILVWRVLMCNSVYFFNPLFPPVPTVQSTALWRVAQEVVTEWLCQIFMQKAGWVLTVQAWLRPIHKGRKPARPGPKPLSVIKPVSLYMSSEQSGTETQVLGGEGDTVSWYVFPRDTPNNSYLAIFINLHFGYEDIGLWVNKIKPTSSSLLS